MILNSQIERKLKKGFVSPYITAGDMGEEYRKLNQQRVAMRSVYQTPQGKAMLVRIIKDSGVFSATEGDTSRNFCIHMLESMGILDEGNIARIVGFMLDGTAVVPEPSEIGMKNTGDENAE